MRNKTTTFTVTITHPAEHKAKWLAQDIRDCFDYEADIKVKVRHAKSQPPATATQRDEGERNGR
jgi:hypothetical protein